jgi:predicted GIY-YIG superfamily endonuclease
LNTWWVYIVEKRKRFYVGITTDLANRMRQHGNPELLYKEGPMKREEAVTRERTLKGFSRKKKFELIDSGVIRSK